MNAHQRRVKLRKITSDFVMGRNFHMDMNYGLTVNISDYLMGLYPDVKIKLLKQMIQLGQNRTGSTDITIICNNFSVAEQAFVSHFLPLKPEKYPVPEMVRLIMATLLCNGENLSPS